MNLSIKPQRPRQKILTRELNKTKVGQFVRVLRDFTCDKYDFNGFKGQILWLEDLDTIDMSFYLVPSVHENSTHYDVSNTGGNWCMRAEIARHCEFVQDPTETAKEELLTLPEWLR